MQRNSLRAKDFITSKKNHDRDNDRLDLDRDKKKFKTSFTAHVPNPNYNEYLSVAEGERNSKFGKGQKAERNVLRPYYGVIPYEDLYHDVYQAVHAYANLLCSVNGFDSRKMNDGSDKSINIGCAVLLDKATGKRKLLFVPSGLKTFLRFINQEFPAHEKMAALVKKQNSPDLLKLNKLVDSGQFEGFLHYFANFSKDFAQVNFDNRYQYGCSEPILYDECEKFLKENPNHEIQGTAEFKTVIVKDQNKLLLVDFKPQESCSAQCEEHAHRGYYNKARNRNSLMLSPLRSRPIGESFQNRINHYSNLIKNYQEMLGTKKIEDDNLLALIRNLNQNQLELSDNKKIEIEKLHSTQEKIAICKIEIEKTTHQLQVLTNKIAKLHSEITLQDFTLENIKTLRDEYEKYYADSRAMLEENLKHLRELKAPHQNMYDCWVDVCIINKAEGLPLIEGRMNNQKIINSLNVFTNEIVFLIQETKERIKNLLNEDKTPAVLESIANLKAKLIDYNNELNNALLKKHHLEEESINFNLKIRKLDANKKFLKDELKKFKDIIDPFKAEIAVLHNEWNKLTQDNIETSAKLDEFEEFLTKLNLFVERKSTSLTSKQSVVNENKLKERVMLNMLNASVKTIEESLADIETNIQTNISNKNLAFFKEREKSYKNMSADYQKNQSKVSNASENPRDRKELGRERRDLRDTIVNKNYRSSKK